MSRERVSRKQQISAMRPFCRCRLASYTWWFLDLWCSGRKAQTFYGSNVIKAAPFLYSQVLFVLLNPKLNCLISQNCLRKKLYANEWMIVTPDTSAMHDEFQEKLFVCNIILWHMHDFGEVKLYNISVSSFIVTLVSASESRCVKILPKMADDVL